MGNTLEKFEAVEAYCKLKTKLTKAFTGVFIWGGISGDTPAVLLVKADQEIDVPSEFKWRGKTYDVIFEVKSTNIIPRQD